MKIIHFCLAKNDCCYFDWQFLEYGGIGHIENSSNSMLTKNYCISIGNRWDGLFTGDTCQYWKPLGFDRGVLYG